MRVRNPAGDGGSEHPADDLTQAHRQAENRAEFVIGHRLRGNGRHGQRENPADRRTDDEQGEQGPQRVRHEQQA